MIYLCCHLGLSAQRELKDVFFVTQMQQLIDLVLTCKRNAENEVRREEGGGGMKVPGRKRKLEQEMAERALKFLKASQEPGRHSKIPGEETRGLFSLLSNMHHWGFSASHVAGDVSSSWWIDP